VVFLSPCRGPSDGGWRRRRRCGRSLHHFPLHATLCHSAPATSPFPARNKKSELYVKFSELHHPRLELPKKVPNDCRKSWKFQGIQRLACRPITFVALLEAELLNVSRQNFWRLVFGNFRRKSYIAVLLKFTRRADSNQMTVFRSAG